MELYVAVQDFLEGYFATHRRSVKTQSAYRIDLAQFRDNLPNATLEAVDAGALERWAKELTHRGYLPASIRRKFAVLRSFFQYWVRKEVLQSSPLWKIRLELERERRLPRALAATDIQRMLGCAWTRVRSAGNEFLNLRNLMLIELLFATGLRVGELATLSISDWNADDKSFIVMGKGAKQRLALLPDIRSIKLTERYLKQRRRVTPEHDALFINVRGARLSTQGIARVLAALGREAGLTSKVTPHMIRHTVATLLLRHGADIRVVQEVLGHSSITMTQRYTQVSKEHLRSTLLTSHPNHHFRIPGRRKVAA